MITHLKHKQINKQKWDNCIQRSLNKTLYAESIVLDFFCGEWEALIENDYETVMPLTKGKKFGIQYLYHPIVLQQLGVFSAKEVGEQTVERFINAIPAQYKYVEIYLNKMNPVAEGKFQLKENINYELNLNTDYTSIQKNYSENLKRNIKRARTKQLALIKDVPPQTVLSLFIDTTGKRINSYSDKDYKKMLDFMHLFSNKERGISYALITPDKKICSAAFFLKSDKRITYLKGASTEFGRDNGGMHLLFDLLIHEYSGKEIVLDFGGSNIPSLARFYKNFGAKDYVYLQLKKNKLSRLAKWVKSLTP
jgi:hypothetical protein